MWANRDGVDQFKGRTMGSMNPLARLFCSKETTINEPEDGEKREEILMDANNFVKFGVHRKTVGLLTQKGRVFMEVKEAQGVEIIVIDFYPRGSDKCFTFFMNKSSMKEFGDSLRKSKDKKVAFDAIMRSY